MKKFQILVCKGPECGDKRGSSGVFDAFQARVQAGLAQGTEPVEVSLERYSCFGKCQSGVNVLVREVRPGEVRGFLFMPTAMPGAVLYHGVRPEDARRICDEHVAGGKPVVELTKRAAAQGK